MVVPLIIWGEEGEGQVLGEGRIKLMMITADMVGTRWHCLVDIWKQERNIWESLE